MVAARCGGESLGRIIRIGPPNYAGGIRSAFSFDSQKAHWNGEHEEERSEEFGTRPEVL